jgi:hypothetical protein
VEDAGRALVIAFNKWDLTDDERRRYLRREIERDLVHFEWASKINISALTGRHVDHLGAAIKGSPDWVGDARLYRKAECLSGSNRGGASASGTWRQAAPDSVRDGGACRPADLRAVYDRAT